MALAAIIGKAQNYWGSLSDYWGEITLKCKAIAYKE